MLVFDDLNILAIGSQMTRRSATRHPTSFCLLRKKRRDLFGAFNRAGFSGIAVGKRWKLQPARAPVGRFLAPVPASQTF